MIEVEDMSKRYGEVLAVDGISFRVGEGEVVGFLGPNGAGKSTTLKILTCYQPATRGTVRVAGFDVLTHSLEVRERLGYLPENVPVYPDMRVEEYLRFRALLKGVRRRDVETRIGAALERCGCAEMRRRMIFGLSKGYRQRVGIADAILSDPPLLVLDEPTSGLDPNQRVEVRKLIASLGENKTVILSSHILAEVEAVAKRVIIIAKGHIVADGTPADLTRRYAGDRRVHIEARGDAAAMRRALRDVPGIEVVSVETLDEGQSIHGFTIRCDGDDDRREALAKAIATSGALRQIEATVVSLESIFGKLTMGEEAA